MRNGLAIEIKPVNGWKSIAPAQGEATLEPGESIDLDVTFDLGMVGSGTRDGAVVLHTNDMSANRGQSCRSTSKMIPNNPPEIRACAVNPRAGTSGITSVPVRCERHMIADGHIVDKWWNFR
jgi:hypothetical protein